MKMRNKSRSYGPGQVIVAVLIALLVMGIIVPALVFFVQRESVWSVKQAQNQQAYANAELGQENAYYVVSQSSAVWSNWQSGKDLAGYMFDQTYTSSVTGGGYYTLFIGSGPSAGQVTVISVGRDPKKKEMRGLKAIYDQTPLSAGIYGNLVTSTGSVHWGSIMSRGTLTWWYPPVGGVVTACFPQLYAIGGIKIWNGANTANCFSGGSPWTATSSPCSGGGTGNSGLWYAYNCTPGVPAGPSIAMAEYATLAQAASCPSNGAGGPTVAKPWPAGASPANSCYWPSGAGSITISTDVSMASQSTIYLAGSANTFTVYTGTNSPTFLYGSIIVEGSFQTSPCSIFGCTSGPAAYSTAVSSIAYQNYSGFDTSAANEWYGDTGGGPPSTPSTSFSLCQTGAISLGTQTKDCPNIRGFVYVGGSGATAANFTSSTTTIHGVLYVPNGTVNTATFSTLNVYYDSATAAAIRLTNMKPMRISWTGITYNTWPGP